MKKLALILLILGCTSNEPKLYFPSSEILLGDVKLYEDKSIKFEFTNKGNKPLIIENVNSSCKCLVSEFPKNGIEKNEKGIIKLLYKSDELGGHRESIVIISNDPKKFKIIRISTNVIL